MKILFLSQRFLFPMDTGGKIRTGKLLEQLSKVFDITLISNVESPKDDPYLDKIKGICSEFHPVYWKEARKYSMAFYFKVLWRLFSRYPITVINDYSADLERKILKVLKDGEYDLLICDFLQPSLNFRKIKGYPTLLFQHNVESVLVKRHFDTAGNPFLKLFWRSQWKKMKRYEQKACQRFHGLVAVSDVDKETLERELGARNVFSIPTGIDTAFFTPRDEPIRENSLVFTGSMDWLPNEDAILFFAREVLGKIKTEIPSVRLSVVGRNPSRYLINELKQYPEIEIVGWVKDVRPYISRHALYIIPLRIGGGTRIKAYEAMAMGKALVSTLVGIEGLQIQDGDYASLADRPEDFAQAVVKLLKHPEERRRIEKAARDFVEKNFSWEKAAVTFATICKEVSKQQSSEGSSMSTWDHNSHEKFYDYYKSASQTDKTLQRFCTICDCVLRIVAQRKDSVGSFEVADVGCGAGTQSMIWADLGHHVHGLDVNRPLIELAQERAAAAGYDIDFQVGSAVELPWSNASMDICIVPELLEHVVEWEACLNEFDRILRPGGILYLTTTNKLCPIQHEFNLPFYSWYPAVLKRYVERLSLTTHPSLTNFAKYPAVNWFTFYSLRAFLAQKGFISMDRFDMMDLSKKGATAKAIVSIIRGAPIIRWFAHIASLGTIIVGVKKDHALGVTTYVSEMQKERVKVAGS